MVYDFSNDDYIDVNFKKLALEYLSKLEVKYHPEELKKIQVKKLRVLIGTMEDFKPKSHIRPDKRRLLKYLYHFVEHPVKNHSYKELLELKVKYIFPVTDSKLRKYGYTSKWGWLGGLLFILPIDILLWISGLGKYYFYIPIISIPFIIKQLRHELKAKRENKLW